MDVLTVKMDKITENLNEDELNLFFEAKFPYVMSKANNYLQYGPEKYRLDDAFGLPLEESTNEELTFIKNGCEQIMDGRGFLLERPFNNIGVSGFYSLFNTFHFKSVKRKTKRLGIGKMIDEITFEHVMDGSQVTYFNFIERK